ncbi:unnamed protein product [Ilex paraguariensis]|uniref:Uncharacterized protein n=1 Tax=Ilex paraguariensis TaxID=185542 RepID=A0ABC8RKF4_9AQUA
MGNHISFCRLEGSGKVILSNGTVHRYDKPLTVAELMLEYPQEAVVEIQSVLNGKKPCPLPADNKLETNKVYLMLPMKRGKPAVLLSSGEARRILLRANSVLKTKSLLSASGFLPLFARICPASAGEGQDQFVLHRKEKLAEKSEETSKQEVFDEIVGGTPEYLSRQFSGKGWKPSLDTIKEKKVKTKVPHWLF